MALHVAVLGVHVRDAADGQMAVAIGEGAFASHERIGRIPDELHARVLDTIEHRRGLGARADVTGMLVLEPDDDPFAMREPGQVLERPRHGVESPFGLGGAPVGEDAHNPGAGKPADLERAFGQARLVFKGVSGTEDILLEAGVDFERARQHALQ